MGFSWFRRSPPASGARVGFFGKLPQFADFVQHQASFGEASELTEWFREGLVALERDEHPEIHEDYDGSPSVQFIFHGAPARDDGPALIGVFRGSNDTVGRRYPFAIFAALGGGFPSDSVRLAPIAFAGFLEAAEALIEEASSAEDVHELIARVSELPAPTPESTMEVLEDYRRFVQEARTGGLLSAACGQGDSARLVAAQRVYSLCESVRGRPDEDTPLALRSPLPQEHPASAAAFWLDLMVRLLGWKSPRPVAYWTPHADRPYLLALLGRPTGRTFLHLLRDDITDDALCDLSAPSKMSIRPETAALPLCSDGVLDDVLSHAGKL